MAVVLTVIQKLLNYSLRLNHIEEFKNLYLRGIQLLKIMLSISLAGILASFVSPAIRNAMS